MPTTRGSTDHTTSGGPLVPRIRKLLGKFLPLRQVSEDEPIISYLETVSSQRFADLSSAFGDSQVTLLEAAALTPRIWL